jgi:hypothetical protein
MFNTPRNNLVPNTVPPRKVKRKTKRNVFPVSHMINKFNREKLLKVVDEMTDSLNKDCITLEPFNEMTDNKLQTLVYISKSKLRKRIKRVHVFPCESLYNHCISRIDRLLKPNDPLNPDHILQEIDLQFLEGLCNTKRTFSQVPNHIDLIFGDLLNGFSSIIIQDLVTDLVILHLGVLPNDIEPEETISLDICSSVVMSNLKRLWDEHRFLDINKEPFSANWFPRHTIVDYINDEGELNMNTFIEFAETIEQEIITRKPNNII